MPEVIVNLTRVTTHLIQNTLNGRWWLDSRNLSPAPLQPRPRSSPPVGAHIMTMTSPISASVSSDTPGSLDSVRPLGPCVRLLGACVRASLVDSAAKWAVDHRHASCPGDRPVINLFVHHTGAGRSEWCRATCLVLSLGATECRFHNIVSGSGRCLCGKLQALRTVATCGLIDMLDVTLFSFWWHYESDGLSKLSMKLFP